MELSEWFNIGGGSSQGSLPGSVLKDMSAYTAGVRMMIPVQDRVSTFLAAGGGAGNFHYPVITTGAKPSLASNSVWHGVFDFGGGFDLRLSQRLSIRTEVRDFVAAKGLSGSSGRHHIMPLLGFSFHF